MTDTATTTTSSTPVAKVTTERPEEMVSPTLVKVLQTRATTPRLLKIVENHTAALEPQVARIHSVSQSSIVISFWGVTPAEGDDAKKTHVGASEPVQQFATIPFATPLPADPTSPDVKYDDEFVGEMVSRIVTLSSIPATSKGKKISIKVDRYIGPDSFISVVSIVYYVSLSVVLLSWLFREQIAKQIHAFFPESAPAGNTATGTTPEAGIFGHPGAGGAQQVPPTPTAADYVNFCAGMYYDFLATRLFSTDFKFKMIGAMHAWVAIGRLGALLTMRTKLRVYKVTSIGTWLAWMLTAGVEGRPCVDRFQDEVRRLWVEGMEKDKKDE